MRPASNYEEELGCFLLGSQGCIGLSLHSVLKSSHWDSGTSQPNPLSNSFRLTDMVFLSWAPPTQKEQKACIDRSGGFNYEAKFRGATAKSLSSLQEDKGLSENGFLCNHARVLVGSGLETFEKGKRALQDWRHFGLNWAFVDPKTPVQNGVKFCVCVKEFLPWVMMPLQIVYVNENRSSKQSMASFRFGGGTLQGHLLAGEERFSIELDENNKVWYEILSFSKPAHLLSFIGYPYVMLRQSSTNKCRLGSYMLTSRG